MKKMMKDVITGIDGETFDVVRILAVLTILIALGLTVYVVVFKESPFDLQSYGIGIGALFTAVGAALKLKESTEPPAKE